VDFLGGILAVVDLLTDAMFAKSSRLELGGVEIGMNYGKDQKVDER
jgi:hypothetical protein